MSDTTTTNGQENTSAQNDGINIQEHIDKGVGIGFAKGAEKATSDILADLGVANLEDVKTAIAANQANEEANKTELEKLQEQLTNAQAEREKLENNLNNANKKAKISTLASQNGISDVDYLEFKYDKASTQDGFDESKFLEEFKGNGSGVTPPPPTDNSNNNNQNPNEIDVSKITDMNTLTKLARASN